MSSSPAGLPSEEDPLAKDENNLLEKMSQAIKDPSKISDEEFVSR